MNNNFFLPITQNVKQLPVYLYSLGGFESQKHVIRPTGYPYLHLFFCVKGSGIIKFENSEHIIDTNSVAVFLANEFHEYYPSNENWATRWIVFGGKEINDLIKSFGIEKSCVLKLNSIAFLEKDYNSMLNSIHSMDRLGWNPFFASSVIYSLIMKLLSYDYADSNVTRSLSYAVKFIENNFQNSISVEDISKTIDVSPQYLCKLFKATYKMRPFEYLNMIRINKAKQLLTQSDYKVAEIAKMCGFNETSYFCSKFKQLSGVTPKIFRILSIGNAASSGGQ